MNFRKGLCFLLLVSSFAAISHQQSDSDDSDDSDISDDSCGDVNGDSLQMVVVVMRHGDRTPKETFPTDPWQDHWGRWGGLGGQLTQLGMKQSFKIGTWMRNCYDSFFGEAFNLRNVLARSTNYNRSIMTAEAYLAGVYPPSDSQVWSDSADLAHLWQPITVNTVPLKEDYLLLTRTISCPAYQEFIADRWAHFPLFKKIRAKYQWLMDYIADKAGLSKPVDLEEIGRLVSDTVFVEKLNDLRLPHWMRPNIVEKLLEWKDLWYIAELGDDEGVRLGAGQLVATLQDLFVNKTRGLTTLNHVVYSGHDFDVGGILGAYGYFFDQVPPIASTVITELHKIKGHYFVKAFYRKNPYSFPKPLKIRDCKDPCPLSHFFKQMKPVSIADRSKVCFEKESSSSSE